MTSRPQRPDTDQPDLGGAKPADCCWPTRRGRGRPRLDEATALTDTIVERALAIFRQHGFAATTMDEVAGACGSAKHSIYRRFASKEELFSAAIAMERRRLIDSIDRIEICSLDSLAALRELAHSILRLTLIPGNVDLLRICIAETQRFPVIAEEFMETSRQIYGLFVPLVIRAQAENRIKPGNPEEIARRLHHTTTSEALLAALLGSPLTQDPDYWDACFEMSWKIVMDGLRVPPAPTASPLLTPPAGE